MQSRCCMYKVYVHNDFCSAYWVSASALSPPFKWSTHSRISVWFHCQLCARSKYSAASRWHSNIPAVQIGSCSVSSHSTMHKYYCSCATQFTCSALYTLVQTTYTNACTVQSYIIQLSFPKCVSLELPKICAAHVLLDMYDMSADLAGQGIGSCVCYHAHTEYSTVHKYTVACVAVNNSGGNRQVSNSVHDSRTTLNVLCKDDVCSNHLRVRVHALFQINTYKHCSLVVGGRVAFRVYELSIFI